MVRGIPPTAPPGIPPPPSPSPPPPSPTKPECSDEEFNTLEQYVGDRCFTQLSAQRVNMEEYLKQGQAGDDPAQWTVMHTIANRVCFGQIPTHIARSMACVPYVLANWPASVGTVYDVPTIAALQADEWQISMPPASPPACDTRYPCMGPKASVTMCCDGYACGGTAPNWYTFPSELQCMDCSEVRIVWNRHISMFEAGEDSAYSWTDDAVEKCVARGIPPSTPPPMPPPPPPSPPADDTSALFNDPTTACGGACIGGVTIAGLCIFFGIIYYFCEREKKGGKTSFSSEGNDFSSVGDVELNTRYPTD